MYYKVRRNTYQISSLLNQNRLTTFVVCFHLIVRFLNTTKQVQRKICENMRKYGSQKIHILENFAQWVSEDLDS